MAMSPHSQGTHLRRAHTSQPTDSCRSDRDTAYGDAAVSPTCCGPGQSRRRGREGRTRSVTPPGRDGLYPSVAWLEAIYAPLESLHWSFRWILRSVRLHRAPLRRPAFATSSAHRAPELGGPGGGRTSRCVRAHLLPRLPTSSPPDFSLPMVGRTLLSSFSALSHLSSSFTFELPLSLCLREPLPQHIGATRPPPRCIHPPATPLRLGLPPST